MAFLPSVLDAIGNTPLIRLRRASEETGCTILGKAEFLNPGQSVKDRAALFIIRDAEKRGLLRPGGVIVEGTAGNTGIGLALVASALGYRTVIVIPETQSQEKKDALRPARRRTRGSAGGALPQPEQLREAFGPARRSSWRSSEPNGAIWANQFDNVANRQGHVETTAPEIWRQTDGKVDGFICAVGSGGTLAGVAEGLRAKKRRREDRARRPGRRRALFLLHDRRVQVGRQLDHGRHRPGPRHRQSRRLQAGFRLSHPRRRGAAADLRPDHAKKACASAARPGINIAGAIRMAREMGPGHTIVTVLCDYGNRYQSKLFNPDFLRSKNLPVPDWIEKTPDMEIPFEPVES